MRDDIRDEVSASGHRTGTNESTVSRVIDEMSLRNSGLFEADGCSAVGGNRCSEPTDET